MTSIRNDGHDDSDGGAAAEQSETRMRQALERLSGDRPAPERSVSERAPDRSVFQRPGGQSLERFNSNSGQHTGQNGGSGSFSSAGPRRHRYVQDGEVPVVQMSTVRDRRRDPSVAPQPVEPQMDAGRAALGLERTARMRAEQALERAQAMLHGLETRLGHAEITLNEATAAVRELEQRNAALQGELTEQADKLREAERLAGEALRRQTEAQGEQRQARTGRPIRVTRTPRLAKPATPPPIETEEPEPVKWWLNTKPKARRSA